MSFEAIIIIIFFIAIFVLFQLWQNSQDKLKQTTFSKQSQSVKYGQLSEQWMPFLKDYPYDSQEFRFIGKPIDGIQFEEDKIIFIEFKTNQSQLSPTQKKIKSLVEQGKVRFEERRLR